MISSLNVSFNGTTVHRYFAYVRSVGILILTLTGVECSTDDGLNWAVEN